MMPPKIDKCWTLFLDRDGVINHRIPNHYISEIRDFKFTIGALEALANFKNYFARIIIVTNQKGVGKGSMSTVQLKTVHQHMIREIEHCGGRIDALFACTQYPSHSTSCHKPNPYMAIQSQKEYPEIDFAKSIMVGDSISDMEFGKRLGMTCVLIEGKEEEAELSAQLPYVYRFASLFHFYKNWFQKKN